MRNDSDFESRGNICIAIPVRDRDWVLPFTLEGIYNQDYPKEKIGIKFIVNDSKDNSFRMLMNFKRKYGKSYRYINIYTYNIGALKDNRDANIRDKTVWIMARLKNNLLDVISRRDNYWFYMDSDIILIPSVLKILIGEDKDFIGGLCNNRRESKTANLSDSSDIYNFLMYDHHMNSFSRNFDSKMIINSDKALKVDLVAGMQMIKYWLATRLKFNRVTKKFASEDENPIRKMMDMEIERWIHPKAFGYHIMTKEKLESYVKETGNKGLVLDVYKREEVSKEELEIPSSSEEANNEVI